MKFAPTVAASARNLLAERRSFGAATGAPGIDALNARWGARGARPLTRAGTEGAAGRTIDRERLRQVAAMHPERTKRAGANPPAAPDLSNLYVLEIAAEADVHQAAVEYTADPHVIYAHPDYEVDLDYVPNDPFFSTTGSWGQSYADLWGMRAIEAELAWDVATGAGVVIAVLDTGIDASHTDLAGNVWAHPLEVAGNGIDDDGNGFVDDLNGWDFVGDDADPSDDNGHGTHVAATAAGVGDDGAGVIGVAWQARVMPVKFLDSRGDGSVSGAVEAILYAVESGADVLNNSWRVPVAPALVPSLVDAVTTARSLGVVVVAAAGNDAGSANAIAPAGIDGVITVGATEPLGSLAGFSNSGTAVDVAAPGVDVLSARAAGTTLGPAVGANHVRLDGTSMASPHVAGLAALLLAHEPTLTVDEVAWHLETHADQPGWPGYEGEAYNPYFGFGIVDGARVFDPVPITTRVRSRFDEAHLFAGVVTPGVGELDISFTTHDPVPWTLSAPPPVEPSAAAGTGDAVVGLSLDATALAPGPFSVSVDLDAPSSTPPTVSAGGDVYLHQDHRVSPPIVISDPDVVAWNSLPLAASNGLGTLVVWTHTRDLVPGDSADTLGAFIDSAGNTSEPFLIRDRPAIGESLLVAHEGGYLLYMVAFTNRMGLYGEYYSVMRLGPDGRPLDSVPLLLGKRKRATLTASYGLRDAGWDGESFAFMWAQLRFASATERYWLTRMRPDGVVTNKPRVIYPAGGLRVFVNADLECGFGRCLFWWNGRASPGSGPFFATRIYSFEIDGNRFRSRDWAQALQVNGFWEQVASNGSQILGVGNRFNFCDTGGGPVYCRDDAIAGRLALDGSEIDVDPIVLNVGSEDDVSIDRVAYRVVWDGTHFVAVYYVGGPGGRYLFAQRLGDDGVPIETELEGALLVRAPTRGTLLGATALAADARHSVVVGAYNDDADEIPAYSTIQATPVFPKAPPSDFVPAEIGSIGALAVPERGLLRRWFRASGLNPESTVFSATGLPEGAMLEAATGLLQFAPHGLQQGIYALRIEATDGSATRAEDVTLTVSEAKLTLSGVVTNRDTGEPAAGLRLRVRGIRKERPSAFTDRDGRYTIEGLEPGRSYRIGLDRDERRYYRMDPPSLVVVMGAADITDAHLAVYR